MSVESGTDPLFAWEGTSKGSDEGAEPTLEDAIRAAVRGARVEPGTKLIVSHIEVTTIGDPNIGSYRVILTPGGG